jgi:hypothetical protein
VGSLTRCAVPSVQRLYVTNHLSFLMITSQTNAPPPLAMKQPIAYPSSRSLSAAVEEPRPNPDTLLKSKTGIPSESC